jgi:hypothetical protein
MRFQTSLVLLVALGTAGVGCSSASSSEPALGNARVSLHRARGCGDLLEDLKADARAKLDRAIDRAISDLTQCRAALDDASCGSWGGGYAASDASGGRAVGAPEAAGAPSAGNGSGSKGSAGSASSYSETNTQVKGVDEADIVKNDGTNLYVLHGRAFKIVKAWPATDLAAAASLDIEGTPSEMFASGGRAVVYSTVNGTSIFQAAGVTPKASYQDFGYGGGGVGLPARGIAPEGDVAKTGDPGTGEPYAPLTKVTVLDLTSGAPVVAREVYFEGSYQTARRVGTHVRTVLSGAGYGPELLYSTYDLALKNGADPSQIYESTKTATQTIAELEQLRSYNRAKIDATQIGDWLPHTFLKDGAGVRAKTVACEDVYVPTAGSTESGLTEVAAIDLANPGADPRETAILGRVDTVYANAGKMVLAAHGWVEPPRAAWWSTTGNDSPVASTGSGSAQTGNGAAPPPASTPVPAPAPSPSGTSLGTKTIRPLDATGASVPPRVFSTTETHLHELEFTTDPTFPNYVASGTVTGSVKDQFAIDEKDGFVRVATTEDRTYLDEGGLYVSALPNDAATGAPSPRPSNVNHVFVLGQSGPWLDQVGSAGELAPNEQIYSVRYVGSRAYVVTFRRVDPLFVVDLATPRAPKVLAALKIPGFSEYMHPVDETHLLTIGRDADANGRTRGLQLQIFDVADGANPVLQHKFTYTGDEYGQSEAEYDHKAFTYFDDKGLLAFPYYAYNANGMRSSLELFRVDLGAGFTKVGSIDHTPLLPKNQPQGYCGGYYAPSVRRGVFLEDFVYSVSYAGIVVRDARNLGAPLSQLALPAPQINDGYGPVCAY